MISLLAFFLPVDLICVGKNRLVDIICRGQSLSPKIHKGIFMRNVTGDAIGLEALRVIAAVNIGHKNMGIEITKYWDKYNRENNKTK